QQQRTRTPVFRRNRENIRPTRRRGGERRHRRPPAEIPTTQQSCDGVLPGPRAPLAPRPRRSRHLRCCSGGGDPGQPPQEAVLEAISKVARSKGRVALTTNMVLGGTVTDDASDEWLVLDQKVNSYPTNRGFTAIGTGGDDFVQSMVVAVESVLQEPIPKGQVSHKCHLGGSMFL
ncbi:Os04g0386500, partial [Oryza sativa Japonica Group]